MRNKINKTNVGFGLLLAAQIVSMPGKLLWQFGLLMSLAGLLLIIFDRE